MKQSDLSGDPRPTLERFSSLREHPANWGQNVSARYIKTILQESTAETAALSVNTWRVAGKRTEEGCPPPGGLTTELLLFARGRTADGRRLLDFKQEWSRSGWLCVSISRGWSQQVELPPEIRLRPTSRRAAADLHTLPPTHPPHKTPSCLPLYLPHPLRLPSLLPD